MNTELNEVQQLMADKYTGAEREKVIAFFQEKNRRWDLLLETEVAVEIFYTETISFTCRMSVARVLMWRRDGELSSRYWEVTLPSGKKLFRSTSSMEMMRWADQAASDRELDKDLQDAFCS